MDSRGGCYHRFGKQTVRGEERGGEGALPGKKIVHLVELRGGGHPCHVGMLIGDKFCVRRGLAPFPPYKDLDMPCDYSACMLGMHACLECTHA